MIERFLGWWRWHFVPSLPVLRVRRLQFWRDQELLEAQYGSLLAQVASAKLEIEGLERVKKGQAERIAELEDIVGRRLEQMELFCTRRRAGIR